MRVAAVRRVEGRRDVGRVAVLQWYGAGACRGGLGLGGVGVLGDGGPSRVAVKRLLCLRCCCRQGGLTLGRNRMSEGPGGGLGD